MDDLSVPLVHKTIPSGLVDIPFDSAQLEKYVKRLISAITEKVCEARKGYDVARPLLPAIYVNEYISIYLGKPELEALVKRYEAVFDAIAPFSEVVFWNLGNDGVFQVKPSYCPRHDAQPGLPGPPRPLLVPSGAGAPWEPRSRRGQFP